MTLAVTPVSYVVSYVQIGSVTWVCAAWGGYLCTSSYGFQVSTHWYTTASDASDFDDTVSRKMYHDEYTASGKCPYISSYI